MGVGPSNENNLPPTPSGQRPSKSDISPVPEASLPERFLTAPLNTLPRADLQTLNI